MELSWLTLEELADPDRPRPSWTGALWLAGQVPPPPRVAIVGARAASGVGRARATALVQAAARVGVSVVSGGARGIDASVHRAALRAGVPQFALVPCFQDDPYPPEHADLFAAISSVARSGVVYARGQDQAPSKGLFLSRNRLVVGASAIVVVIEAGLRSGSVATGRMALQLGRAVRVVPGSPGTDALLERGARGIRIDPDDPGAVEAALRRGLSGGQTAAAQWPVALRAAALRLEPGRCWLTADDFADPGEGTAALVEAEALGEVVEVSPGRYIPSG